MKCWQFWILSAKYWWKRSWCMTTVPVSPFERKTAYFEGLQSLCLRDLWKVYVNKSHLLDISCSTKHIRAVTKTTSKSSTTAVFMLSDVSHSFAASFYRILHLYMLCTTTFSFSGTNFDIFNVYIQIHPISRWTQFCGYQAVPLINKYASPWNIHTC